VLVDGPVFFVEAVSVASEELGIEMSVFHQEYFKELLKQGVIYAIIVPFYPKNEFAWLEKIDLQPYVNDIEYYAMRQMLKTELDFKWKKCKHLWSTGDFIVPPKIASHVIRYILHAIDLATKGNIPDFTYGNEWWDAVRSEHFNQWEDCESKYRPIADKFMAKLDAISTAIDDFLEYETTVEAQWQAAKASSGSPTMRLVLFDFIAKHGFAGLKRVFNDNRRHFLCQYTNRQLCRCRKTLLQFVHTRYTHDYFCFELTTSTPVHASEWRKNAMEYWLKQILRQVMSFKLHDLSLCHFIKSTCTPTRCRLIGIDFALIPTLMEQW
jgi:hypothetical protein